MVIKLLTNGQKRGGRSRCEPPRAAPQAFRLLAWWVMAWVVACPGLSRQAHAAAPTEYEIKSALLLNFIQFIEWPEWSFSDENAPIVVGVLGEDPFGTILERTFNDESVGGRRLAIRRSRQIEDLRSCHVLFVSRSEKDRLGEILASVHDLSVVTVGETDDFARRGGIINFYVENNKIRFEINAGAAQRKGLKISSQLLRRARIVG